MARMVDGREVLTHAALSDGETPHDLEAGGPRGPRLAVDIHPEVASGLQHDAAALRLQNVVRVPVSSAEHAQHGEGERREGRPGDRDDVEPASGRIGFRHEWDPTAGEAPPLSSSRLTLPA